MKRREFGREAKAEMLRRARDAKGRILCEGCGCDLTGLRFEFDHTVAEALLVDKSRKLTAADGRLLGKKCCHDPKTKGDVTLISTAKRKEASHYGLGAGPKRKMQSRGFGRSEAAIKREQKAAEREKLERLAKKARAERGY